MPVEMKRQSITDTLLEQDENVFVSQNSHDKGLQQYYTSLKIAECIAKSMNLQTGTVVDLTAGCGNLLEPFTKSKGDVINTFGVELDKSNIPKATDRMRIVNANLPELYPYLLKVEFQATGVVLNPPFSLFWDTPELTGSIDKKMESQEATIRMGIALMASSGQGAFIVQKSSWDKGLKRIPEIADHVFHTVVVRNAFAPYSAVECVLCFMTKKVLRYRDKPTDFQIVDMNSPDVDFKFGMAQRDVLDAQHRYGLYPSRWEHEDAMEENDKRFRAAHAEYREKKISKKQAFNIECAGGRFKVHLSNYVQYILHKEYTYREKAILEKMHGLSPSYFAFNTQDRRDLFKMVQEKTLVTMSPAAHEAIAKAVVDAEFILAPMYALRPQQRLGYLENIDKIKCTKTFTFKHRGEPHRFDTGQEYDVRVSSQSNEAFYDKEKGMDGKKVEMVKIGKALSIDIGGCWFTESAEDISLIVNHFEIPDPMDVRAKKPLLYDRLRDRLESKEFEKFTLLPFQVEDLSRLAMKESCVLSWEQGLGKTRGALAWTKLRNSKKVMIVCPQDLKRQWTAEAKTLGIDLIEIRSIGDAEAARRATDGYYLIHYELLKGSRRLDVMIPEYKQPTIDENGEEENWNALCPKCKAMRHDGWNGKSCTKCGFHIWLVRVKGIYHRLKRTFDTVIVDEGVKIKSKHSLQGISVRSLHATNRLLLSGSPIKGWITDAYWLLHWTLGNSCPRFPYHYEGGTEKFLDDFGVFEYVAAEFRRSLSRGKKKLLPEIGNLHLLWKLFAPSIVRRLKVDAGLSLVNKNVHRIKVNFTVDQKLNYDWWIANFSTWFKASHITDMDDNAVQMKEMILGLLWKLRFTATVPASRLLPGVASPGMEDTYYPGRVGKSNYTEKALFVLTKCKEIADKGEQIVVFSSLQDNMNFMKQLLTRYGIKAEVANADTSPEKRSMMISDFKAGKFTVLVAGTQAVNLGHNIDNATAVIMTDYEWDHSTTRQAIDRVHRFTSKKDVDVYLLYTDGGVDRKQLFEIIDLKGQSSDLALDGKLMDQEEVQVDFFKIAREIMKEHKNGTDGLLDELVIERKISELFKKTRLAEPIALGGSKPIESFVLASAVTHQTKVKITKTVNQLPLGF